MTEASLYSLQFFDELKRGYAPLDADTVFTVVLPGRECDYVNPSEWFDKALDSGLVVGGVYCFPTLLPPVVLELWYVNASLHLAQWAGVNPLVSTGGSPHMFRLLDAVS